MIVRYSNNDQRAQHVARTFMHPRQLLMQRVHSCICPRTHNEHSGTHWHDFLRMHGIGKRCAWRTSNAGGSVPGGGCPVCNDESMPSPRSNAAAQLKSQLSSAQRLWQAAKLLWTPSGSADRDDLAAGICFSFDCHLRASTCEMSLPAVRSHTNAAYIISPKCRPR